MTLTEKIASAMSVWFDTDRLAQTINYAGTDIIADVSNARQEYEANAVVELIDIEIKVSDITKPQYRDAVIIAGHTCQVKGWIGDGYTWKVTLINCERPLWG